jgi:hypothetical protein
MSDSHEENSNNTEAQRNVTALQRYAVIAGERIALPVDAKFYFQDKRGLWFWSKRKPRVMEGDWTPNKSPVQISTDKGYKRCLMTPTADSREEAWRDTVTRAVNLENRPLAMSPELDKLSVASGE